MDMLSIEAQVWGLMGQPVPARAPAPAPLSLDDKRPAPDRTVAIMTAHRGEWSPYQIAKLCHMSPQHARTVLRQLEASGTVIQTREINHRGNHPVRYYRLCSRG